ncbi:hypothetical protein ABZ611_22050 [Streptomyces sp. NPDC007861]|uniref:hypothetical protein n=1 Tax=Streptomyces sp. NPDC007861 TaxID=3154893 RepID=UPI0033ED09C9
MRIRRALTARAVAVPVGTVLTAVLLAGCGGSDGGGSGVASVEDANAAGDGGSGGGGGGKSDAQQAQEFVGCMRANGVDMEDPDPATGKLNLGAAMGPGADPQAMRKAVEACRDKMPQALKDKAAEKPDAQELENLKRFAACMRENGVDMEDPGPEGLDRGNLDTSDPDFQKALDACREHLTGATGGGR